MARDLRVKLELIPDFRPIDTRCIQILNNIYCTTSGICEKRGHRACSRRSPSADVQVSPSVSSTTPAFSGLPANHNP